MDYAMIAHLMRLHVCRQSHVYMRLSKYTKHLTQRRGGANDLVTSSVLVITPQLRKSELKVCAVHGSWSLFSTSIWDYFGRIYSAGVPTPPVLLPLLTLLGYRPCPLAAVRCPRLATPHTPDSGGTGRSAEAM